MTNMKQKIDNHNKKIMSNEKDKKEVTRTWNCRDKTSWPLKLKENVCKREFCTKP